MTCHRWVKILSADGSTPQVEVVKLNFFKVVVFYVIDPASVTTKHTKSSIHEHKPILAMICRDIRAQSVGQSVSWSPDSKLKRWII